MLAIEYLPGEMDNLMLSIFFGVFGVEKMDNFLESIFSVCARCQKDGYLSIIHLFSE